MASPWMTSLLRWCLDRVRLHIGRHGLRLTQGGGQLGNLYISVDEAARVLEGGAAFDLAGELGLPPAPASGPPPAAPETPLGRIVERFGLDPMEAALLAAAAGPSLGVDVARLYGFAWADFAVKLPPAGFLAELVADDAAGTGPAIARLRPDGALRRAGLLRLEPADAWGGPRAAFVHHGVRVPDPVLACLRGEPPLVGAHATLHPPDGPPDRFAAPAEAVRRLAGLLDGGPILLAGPAGSGRREAARAVCRRREQTLLELELRRLPPAEADFDAALDDALLAARLHGLAVLLTPSADDARDEAQRARRAALERRVAGHAGPIMLRAGGADDAGLGDAGVDGAALVEVQRADSATQRALWLRALGDASLADALTARFDVTPGVLLDALADARRDAASGPDGDPETPPTLAQITESLRRRLRRALDGLSEPVSTPLGWSDVVLPDDVVERLHEIRAHAHHRARVFDTWGFRRKMAYGRGLGCLFSGPPGTGKTMMAGILARDLGRELYRVDLSRVVSKWVGETEKNLGRIFDEAEQAQVILLFDEADSLFSTRTEVKGANDRFANMEVNFLLQRMEAYDGISILTTNFERSLDEAFRRRLKFRVHFPMPDAQQRTELWRRMIPTEMPLEGELDFERLGRAHKMSGGNIKNAVLRAAFYAAEEGGGLTQARLRRAADAESREMGRL